MRRKIDIFQDVRSSIVIPLLILLLPALYGCNAGMIAAGALKGMADGYTSANSYDDDDDCGYNMKYKYDSSTGNHYSYYQDVDCVTHVTGSNISNGTTWTTTIESNGDKTGYDSENNRWTYDATTGRYYNYGTGKTCFGSRASRRCY